MEVDKVAFGGGCHWCTEAVYQSLIGVEKVEQGYVASTYENAQFSEAVIVHFNRECISLKTLIEIHLLTHASSSDHSMRTSYRSAVYTFGANHFTTVQNLLKGFQKNSQETIVTQVLPFDRFKPSRDQITNYYFKNPKKPFCVTYINPKLQLLLKRFPKVVDDKKVSELTI